MKCLTNRCFASCGLETLCKALVNPTTHKQRGTTGVFIQPAACFGSYLWFGFVRGRLVCFICRENNRNILKVYMSTCAFLQ